MNINYEGVEYGLDIEDLDTDQARAMERFGVANLKALEDGIGTGDVTTLTALYWLMLQQNGEPGARIDRVKLKPIKFLKALAAATQEDAEEAPAVPKKRKA